MKYIFIDAETDGLYGDLLSIAAIVCDSKGVELKRFYAYRKCNLEDIEDTWTQENVFPYLELEIKEAMAYSTEEKMIDAFWEFYEEQGENFCIGDTIYPVEANLMRKCVEVDVSNRAMKAPFPLLDLSGMLYAKGIDPKIERRRLVNCKDYRLHNAMDDVRMSIDIWKKYFQEKEQ